MLSKPSIISIVNDKNGFKLILLFGDYELNLNISKLQKITNVK